jgi:glycosyltransferase involved in cell wall biosynthesis
VPPDLPWISIVVPNLNGAPTLDRALDSLINQAYPRLEILVPDGGSSDNSVDIIEARQEHLAWWVSEPDRGQSDAINKGLARCRGAIVNWLCSDDELLPGSLRHVGEAFAANPGTDFLAGACEIAFAPGAGRDFVFRPEPKAVSLLPAYNGIMQQSCFWRLAAIDRSPVLDESFHYTMDFELWCYAKSRDVRWQFTDTILSRFNLSGANKTSIGGRASADEMDRIYRRYTRDRVPLSGWYRRLRYPLECRLRRDRGLARLAILRVWQVIWMLIFMPFYGYNRVRYMSWPEGKESSGP